MRYPIYITLACAAILAACGDDDSSFAPRDTDDSSSSICDDCDDESSSSEKGTATTSSSAKSSSSSSGDLSKYDFVWDTFAEAFNTTCDASREGQVGLARYAEDSELICTHDEYLDKWGWLSPSSSSEASSSSAKSSSSSLKGTNASCKTKSEDNCIYNSVTDERDGQTYKTVIIGDQTWMAENLNYKTENSYCYRNTISNCDTYGRLYTWESASIACPSEWHLPTKSEFEALIAMGGGSFETNNNGSFALLQSLNDEYGFSALEGGDRAYNGSYSKLGQEAYFWSASESDSASSFYLHLRNNAVQSQMAILGYIPREVAYSVRCIKGPSTKSIQTTETTYPGTYGTLTDERDGKTYKTVIIGNQTWMAENLNFAENGSCYANSSENCEKYGRLYTWGAAMDSAGTWSTNSIGCGSNQTCNPSFPVQGICPDGWHLPSYEEFEKLIKSAGDKRIAGRKLKSTTGWFSEGNGTDALGFAALPAGVSTSSKLAIEAPGLSANFWSSSFFVEGSSLHPHHMYILYSDDDVGLYVAGSLYNKHSVRCVQNSDTVLSSSSEVSSSSVESN